MKILKYILLGIVGIIILVLIIAAFAPKSYNLQKEVTINKPASEVYNYMRMLNNQTEWSAWYQMDTKAKIGVIGTDGEVGATWTWDSEITGKGEQKILSLEPSQKIASEIHFIKPFEGLANNDILFEAVDSNHTVVKNTFSSSSPYPMNIMILLADMDKVIGGPIQDGLNNVKTNLEK